MEEFDEKKKILLVDDDEIYLEIAKVILESEYEVYTAKSGKEALGLLLRGFIPNLILLDILMPEMDGWEIFGRLKTIIVLEKVPIAFLTSLDSEAEKKHALKIGAADFIQKPFKKDDLLRRVAAIFLK